MSFQRLGLHLTDRCSLDCSHCLRDPGAKPLDLPLDVIAPLLTEAREQYGIRLVSLTGGEPALHPSFGSILDRIVALDMHWDAVTSGDRFERFDRAFRDERARARACRSLTFSIDGDEATHDEIRGPGAYRRALAAIGRAQAWSIAFGVQMAVHAGNASLVERVALDAARLGARHVSFSMTQPTGTTRDDAMFLPRDAWWALRRRIESLSRALTPRVVLAEGWPDDQPARPCDALRGETLHVDVHGQLTLCCNLSGTPREDASDDVAGSVADGLAVAHGSLLAITHDVMRGRLEIIRSRRGAPWWGFSCNTCLARFGRPHWTDEGAAGPGAARARWRGAWSKPNARRLKVIS